MTQQQRGALRALSKNELLSDELMDILSSERLILPITPFQFSPLLPTLPLNSPVEQQQQNLQHQF